MPDADCRAYLLRGRVVQQPYRTAPAGRCAAVLGTHLDLHAAAHRLGDVFAATGFQVARSPDTVLVPAVAFVRGDASSPLDDEFHSGAPDLAIEVDCPSEEPGHLELKVAEWLEAGCRLVVVVNPRRRAATIYRSPGDVVLLAADDVIDGGDVVPGWTLPLRDLFG